MCQAGATRGSTSIDCISEIDNPITNRTCTVEGGAVPAEPISVTVPCKLMYIRSL